MPRIKCTIIYDGSGFSGYQIQPKKRTVQGELQKALAKIHKGEEILVNASGRTDRGVHAKGQVCHFDTSNDIPESGWKRALNTLLPDDIVVTRVEKVDKIFHARYGAKEKEYRYFVTQEKHYDPFRRNYVYHFPNELNIEEMKRACAYLQGEHDFTTFSSAKTTAKGSKVRTLYEVSCEKAGNELVFLFRGNGFLYNMVRILVSLLLDIGTGKTHASDIPDLFAKKDRQYVGKTAPAEGLYLWEVKYPNT